MVFPYSELSERAPPKGNLGSCSPADKAGSRESSIPVLHPPPELPNPGQLSRTE